MNLLTEILSKVFPAQQAAASTPSPLAAPTPATQNASASNIDINSVLTQMASQKGEKLNWKTSIVDLMKVLDIDSSLEQRKKLATELGFTGSESDTAAMNTWLLNNVMKKFAANGGRVPAELLH